ncbi:MAG: hypothetical protein ABJH06_11530 [Paraglaciecola sp.]|uniref:hypothetical protein n=1 Tax=Paraglaciecola sp. TaxID=1920173 RepID=UPI003263142F
MRKSQLIMIVMFLFLFSRNVMSETVYVVVNEKNTDIISPELVKLIYLDKSSVWSDGTNILVFELPVKSDARVKFCQEVLNMSPVSSQRYWSNRFVNNTIQNEVKIKPHRLVTRFVSAKESAIGYVPESEIHNMKGVRIVMTIN